MRNAGQTFGAIGAQSGALTAGLRQLPATLAQGNQTLANLTPTLDALTQLVDVSKPTTPDLTKLLRALAPLLAESQGPVTNLGLAISRPGPNNDLTDAAFALPALARAVDKVAPASVTALQASCRSRRSSGRTPPTSSARCARSGRPAPTSTPTVTTRASRSCTPTSPRRKQHARAHQPEAGLANLQTGQTRRCPGAAARAPRRWIRSVHRRRHARLLAVAGAGRMNRRSSRSLAGSPLLIGAVTTLVVIVAVFLSYNANNGLPFVPTYNINIHVPDASSLQIGNDVRIGGTRVGHGGQEKAQQNPHTGAVNAVIGLKLEKRLQELPLDTTVVVRDRSSLGEKYLELIPGTSARKLPPGGTLPLSAATPAPVAIDQVLNMFNAPTRVGHQTNTVVYGNGVRRARREPQRHDLQPRPGIRRTSSRSPAPSPPGHHLGGLFAALERATAQVAPVAQESAQAFVELNTTFKALAGVAPSIGQATDDGPAVARPRPRTRSVYERPFIAQLTGFFRLLAPGALALRQAAPSLAAAVEAGVRNLPGAAATNQRAEHDAGRAPGLRRGSAGAPRPAGPAGRVRGGNPIVADLAGMQTQCNYPTLFFRNLASDLAEGTSVGNWLRRCPIFPY